MPEQVTLTEAELDLLDEAFNGFLAQVPPSKRGVRASASRASEPLPQTRTQDATTPRRKGRREWLAMPGLRTGTSCGQAGGGESVVKSPIPYFGGKTSIAERIVSMLPSHSHYVEPFAGSLAVLLAKPRSASETVNDLNGDLMTFWRILRDRRADLERACLLTPHSRGELAASWNEAEDDLERARRTFVRLTQGRGSTGISSGWRHYVSPGVHGMVHSIAAYCGRLGPAAERIAGVTLECRPALDVITRYGASPDVLLYVDPPYLSETRSGGKYVHDEVDHDELLAALAECSSAVVLSGYASELYETRLSDWDRVEIPTMAAQSNVSNKARIEVVWSNREIGHPALFGAGSA